MVDEVITNLVKAIVKEYLDTEIKPQLQDMLKGQVITTPRIEQGIPKLYASIGELCQLFGVGQSKVYEEVKSMEKNPKYSKFVRKTSPKCKEVSVYGFNEYREELASKYLRGKGKRT